MSTLLVLSMGKRSWPRDNVVIAITQEILDVQSLSASVLENELAATPVI